jgi:hypothetical protein
MPKYCQNFTLMTMQQNSRNITRYEQTLFHSFHALCLQSFMYKYIFMFISVYKWLQEFNKFFLSFFLSEMHYFSGFIPLDKFPNFEAHDISVFQHISIGLLNMFYCEVEELFGLPLCLALDKTDRNGSSNIWLH